MNEIPLFPLNTVLFPGMPLTLHIFEDRYKEMVGHCIANDEPFGVVLIREGVEAMGPVAEPHLVGCTAQIAQVQDLPEGRMNILALGRERFRIVSLHHDKPYLTGTVEKFPLDSTDPSGTVTNSRRLLPWVEQYLDLLGQAGDVELDTTGLPDDPLAFTYLAATVLQVSSDLKQELLATGDAGEMLAKMRGLYRRELPLLRQMIDMDEDTVDGPGPFSLN